MTGCELSTWLYYHADFCEMSCGKGIHESSMPCFECSHELAYTMYIIAVDMLETAQPFKINCFT